jgi:hypothetical protein
MDDIVQCPYNPFYMCLKSRLSRHKWKCHNQEYMRDLDLQLQERLHPQEQEQESSWDGDNHPTYVPPVKPWWKKTQEEKKEEKSWDDVNHPTYVPSSHPQMEELQQTYICSTLLKYNTVSIRQ